MLRASYGAIKLRLCLCNVQLAVKNGFLYHCQKQIVPQQSSVPASVDFTPVSPSKAICAALLPQPRPVPDPAPSLHCQVSYFLRRPLRTSDIFQRHKRTSPSFPNCPILEEKVEWTTIGIKSQEKNIFITQCVMAPSYKYDQRLADQMLLICFQAVNKATKLYQHNQNCLLWESRNQLNKAGNQKSTQWFSPCVSKEKE